MEKLLIIQFNDGRMIEINESKLEDNIDDVVLRLVSNIDKKEIVCIKQKDGVRNFVFKSNIIVVQLVPVIEGELEEDLDGE